MSNIIITKPLVKTFFIAWDNDRNKIKAHGVCNINQTVMSPWTEVDLYTNEKEWDQVLTENNITQMK
jgi:hypothetical protein